MGLIARLTRGKQSSDGAYGGIVGMGARRYNAWAWEFQRVANSVYANPTGYRCVQWLANNCSRPEFALTDKNKKPIEDSPLEMLLNNPEVGRTSGTEMQWAWTRDLELAGKSFWVKLRGPDQQLDGGAITSLRRLPPQRVTVVGNDEDELIGFIYADRGGNRALVLPENMLYLRYEHPERQYDGLPPALMAGLGAETDNASARFNYDLLSNDTALPGYVSVTDLTPQQFLEWKAMWESGEHPGKTRFLSGNATYSKVGQSNQEMMYDKLRDSARLDICTAFGVLRQLVDPSDTTFSNMAEAKSLTWQQTVLPKLILIGDQLTTQLAKEFKVHRIFFDLTEIEELQVSAKDRLDRQIRLLDRRALTINEVRIELGYAPVDWGDDPMANLAPNHLGVQPLVGVPSARGQPGQSQSGGGAGGSAEGGGRLPGETPPGSDSGKLPMPSLESTGGRNAAAGAITAGKGQNQPPDGRGAGNPSDEANGGVSKGIQEPTPNGEAPHPWRVFDQRVTTFEARAAKRMEAFFAKQAKNVIARIRGKAGQAITKATNPTQWWDAERWLAELSELGYEFLSDAVDYFGGIVIAEFTDAGVFEANARVADYLTSRSTDIAGLINSTTEDALRAAIADAEAEGLSIGEIVGRVEDYFATNGKMRAEIVARTEIIGAANWATIEGARQSGVATTKTWMATADDRVDAPCVALDSESVDLDAPFSNGADYPPDHPNCRCCVTIETA